MIAQAEAIRYSFRMIIEYPYIQNYLFTALRSGPVLIAHLLEGVTDTEADARPEPERFTIREIVAHLAEWEPILLERMRRIRDEDCPELPGYDEGQLALNHHYALSDLAEQLALFQQRRKTVVAFLEALTPEQWQRVGNRPEIGLISIEGIGLLMPLHDTYHAEQLARYRKGTIPE